MCPSHALASADNAKQTHASGRLEVTSASLFGVDPYSKHPCLAGQSTGDQPRDDEANLLPWSVPNLPSTSDMLSGVSSRTSQLGWPDETKDGLRWYEQPDEAISTPHPSAPPVASSPTELLRNQCPPALPDSCDQSVLQRWSQVLRDMDVESVLMLTCIPAMQAGQSVSVQYPPTAAYPAAAETDTAADANMSTSGSSPGVADRAEPAAVSMLDLESPLSRVSGIPVNPVCPSFLSAQAAVV